MTGRILLGGRQSGRNVAAMLAVSCIPSARMVIEAMKQAEEKAVRTILLNHRGNGIEVGSKVLIDGKEFTVVSIVSGMLQVSVETAERKLTMATPAARKFGGDRPYLKRKKGRS